MYMENFNTVPDKGTFGGSVEVINQNFLLAQQEMGMLRQAYNSLSHGKADESSLQAEITRATTVEENLRQIYNNLQQSQPIPVTQLPATGEAGKIYRLAGTTSYSDYMYSQSDLNTPIKMAEYNNGIDKKPTPESGNLTESGGIAKALVNYTSNAISVSNSLSLGIHQNLLDDSKIEYGSINNDGEPYNDSIKYRARTLNYIPVNRANLMTILNDGTYRLWVYEYDINYNYLLVNGHYVADFQYNVSKNTQFVKILIGNNPESAQDITLDTLTSHIGITLGIDYKKASGVADIHSLRKSNDVLFNIDAVELGSLDTDGLPVESAARLRTKDYIPLTVSDWIYVTSVYGNWKYSFCCYDKDKNFLGNTPYYNFNGRLSLAGLGLVPSYSNTSFVKILFKFELDMDITNDMIRTFDLIFNRINLPSAEGMIELASNGSFLKYENKNAAGAVTAYRLRSDKIFVEPNTTYVVEKKFGYNSTERCSVARYDEDDNLLQDSAWVDDRMEFQITNESYIRITYKYDDTTNVIPYNVIPGYIIRKSEVPMLSAELIPAIPNYFKNGNIGSNGEIVSSSLRLVSGLINVDKTAAINVTCNSSFEVSFATYDKDKNFIEWTLNYSTSRLNYALNYNVGYIRLVVKSTPDGSITPSRIASSDLSVTSSVIGKVNLNKLIVGLWNCGMYNGGVAPAGIPNNELDARLPEVRNLITSISADILVINEEPTSGKIDRNGTISTYDALYKQFYPYHAQMGYWMAVYSKFPISGKVLPSDAGEHRPFFVGYININGESVKFCAVHFSPYNSSDRVAEAEQMAEYMDAYDKCILVGDLNTSNDETEATAELKPFRDKGFNLANRGYWGAKITYPNGSYKIDNIITKGINIDNFTVIEDTSVSDHYPVCSQISF